MDDKIYTRNKWRFNYRPLKFRTSNKLARIGKYGGNKYKGTKGSYKQNRKYGTFISLIAILIIAFTFAYYALKSIEPIMEKQCKAMAKSIATKICNEESSKVMVNYKYEDLLNITKDESGNIKMVTTNMITVNEIISEIPIRIQNQIEKSENNHFSIPLGSFLGINLLSGRGPKVNIKMEVAGSLDTSLRSEFIASGINQTMHKIYLEIECNVIILTPSQTMEEKIVNQVLLAEGVIIGDIPSTYYNLEGMQSDNLLDIVE